VPWPPSPSRRHSGDDSGSPNSCLQPTRNSLHYNSTCYTSTRCLNAWISCLTRHSQSQCRETRQYAYPRSLATFVCIHSRSKYQTVLTRRLGFPLLVTLSLVLSSLLHSLAAEYTSGDLAAVSRRVDESWQLGVLVGWRA
jgi:hypothetical protein